MVFPAPFAPITPTIPPGGSLKVKLSISNLSSKDLDTLLKLITSLPNLGAGGITRLFVLISFFCSCATNSSYEEIRAFDLACLALGADFIH